MGIRHKTADVDTIPKNFSHGLRLRQMRDVGNGMHRSVRVVGCVKSMHLPKSCFT